MVSIFVVIFLTVIGGLLFMKPKSIAIHNEKQLFINMQQQLWESYKTFSIRSQNDIFEKHLTREVREQVVETKQLPEALIEEIRQFHEALQREITNLKEQAPHQSAQNKECWQNFIVYLEARYIFLNKEWAYMRAILQSDEQALEATQLYRQAREKQNQQYRTFEMSVAQRVKKLKCRNLFA